MAYIPVRKALMIAGLTLGASVALAGDPPPPTVSGADGAMLSNTCAGCHGTDGASVGPASPSIAGLSKEYFKEVMKGFKEGKVPATIMDRIAKGYDDAEFAKMADFFAAKPFVKAKQESDKALADKGAKLHEKYCEKCHADGGTSAADDSGILAGQWKPYLHFTLEDYKSGKREATKKMAKKMEEMASKEGDAGYEALINFYASQK
jgi:cytochrome subunit of sulfide dehydrogenase